MQPISISVEKAYHRPDEDLKSPDIVIINVKDRNGANEKGLSSVTQFNHLSIPDKSIAFYVYFNHDTQNFEIKYLTPHRTNSYPLLYRCDDNLDPQPGCSGASVIRAYISTINTKLQWKFYIIGAVYARCGDDPDCSKLACVIPIEQDFEQIRKDILVLEELAERCNSSEPYIRACPEDGDRLADKTHVEGEGYAAQSKKGWEKFEAGKTILNIDLPDGLEKLIGKSIIPLQYSMLLSDFQRQYPDYQFENTIDSRISKIYHWNSGSGIVKIKRWRSCFNI